MPLFAFVGHDGPDGSAKRDPNRAAHLEHLRTLDRKGQIAFAGPLRNEANDASVGAIIVIDMPDLAAAKAYFAADPFTKAGVFERYTIAPFKLGFPEKK